MIEPIGLYIHTYAIQAEIDPEIIAAIIYQESSGNPWAYRYEPSFKLAYINGRPRRVLRGHWPKSITEESERMMRSTSFGLMQIMGQVARECGFDADSLLELCQPQMNIELGVKILSDHRDHYTSIGSDEPLREALRRYNGRKPGDYTYYEKVMSHVQSKAYKEVLTI